jgi:hypothetical protein
MNEHPEGIERSERLLNHLVRALPLRHAPAALESRVLGELERRDALPWWQRGFDGWPLGARAAFAAICCAIMGFTLIAGPWGHVATQVLNDAGVHSMSWAYPAVAAATSAGELWAMLQRSIEPIWLYCAVGAGALLYAILFGLGAAAYRMLYVQSSMHGHDL